MVLKENILYWKHSLENKEPLEEECYIFDEIIINEETFIKKVEQLRKLISEFCGSIDIKLKEKIFNEIYEIIENTENIQHHEFIAFWKVLGTTFSTYKSFTKEKKRERLKQLLLKYCQMRFNEYNNLNYSNITIQALYDKGASRRTGKATNKKIIDILNEYYENVQEAKSINEFEEYKISFFRLDTKSGKDLLDDFCEKHQINQLLSEKSFNITIKIGDHIFLVKTKHMKETGGTQNSKVVELIDFIIYSEESNKIHYITFIDGIFFNRFSDKLITGKTKSHKESIEKTLKNNNNNFFVNTAGLKSILKDLQEKLT